MRRLVPPFAVCVCVGIGACEADDGDRAGLASTQIAVSSPEIEESLAEQLQLNGESIVYEARRAKADNVAAVPMSETGQYDASIEDRSAQPDRFLHEPETYVFHAWRKPLSGEQKAGLGGAVEYEQGVRITSRPNPKLITEPWTTGPPTVDAELYNKDATTAAGDQYAVMIRPRNVPKFYLPVLPRPELISVDAYQQARMAREQVKLSRMATIEQLSAGVTAQVEQLGGEVKYVWWRTGWLYARIPTGALNGLAARNDIRRIARTDGDTSTGQDFSDFRPNDMVGVQPLWADDFKGMTPNPDRHPFGRMTIAVNEPWALEDDACGFRDTLCSGATRIPLSHPVWRGSALM